MNLFKKPEEKYSEEEYNEMRKKIQSMNLSKKDEWLLILMALKTYLPWVIMIILISYGGLLLILFLL